MEDLAGVRIICQFEEDIDTVAAIIRKRTDMEVKSEKNYLTHIKQSGYRSYHMILYYTVETIHGPKRLQVEIQIRTMAMNFWATIEHSLQYKYKGDMPPHVAERLSKASDAIISLDHEMSSVRNEIMDAQNSSQMQSNLVKDILNNIENLYRVSSEREVSKIQDEFLRVFKTKDLRQLERFHRQLDIIAEGYRAQQSITAYEHRADILIHLHTRNYKLQDFLPVTREDMKSRGWDELDFVYVTGDAYVDHPSFGSAIIGRLLESRGYRVGMIPQPDWRKKESIQVFGGTAPGFSRYSRKHGFHGESLYGFQKHRSTDAYLQEEKWD